MATPQLISTPLDVRALVPFLVDSKTGSWEVPMDTISQFILTADGEIRSELRQPYGTDLTVTPYPGIPFWVTDALTGGAVLRRTELSVSSSAISEVWILTFASTTTYGFIGSVSGAQGSAGATGTDSSSTNGYLTVGNTAWDLTTAAAIGDIYYIPTYNYEPALVRISALLAAADLLDAVYGEEVPNTSSDSSERFRRKAEKLLNRLTDPDSQIELECGRVAIDTSPILLSNGMQDIDQFGDWSTDYQPEEGFDH